MRYDDFLDAWAAALRESGLPIFGPFIGEQSLDLRTLERRYEVFVMPPGPQDAAPFDVAVRLSWTWDALTTARTSTTEEDALREFLGVSRLSSPRTERAWLRVEVTLSASVPYGKAIPMPAQARWASWVREVNKRLRSIEPLVPERTYRINKRGRAEVLAFQGEPKAHFGCQENGQLGMEKVEVDAWQAIELPRIWSDSRKRADPPPERKLKELFARVRAASFAWKEALDHLATNAK